MQGAGAYAPNLTIIFFKKKHVLFIQLLYFYYAYINQIC